MHGAGDSRGPNNSNAPTGASNVTGDASAAAGGPNDPRRPELDTWLNRTLHSSAWPDTLSRSSSDDDLRDYLKFFEGDEEGEPLLPPSSPPPFVPSRDRRRVGGLTNAHPAMTLQQWQEYIQNQYAIRRAAYQQYQAHATELMVSYRSEHAAQRTQLELRLQKALANRNRQEADVALTLLRELEIQAALSFQEERDTRATLTTGANTEYTERRRLQAAKYGKNSNPDKFPTNFRPTASTLLARLALWTRDLPARPIPAKDVRSNGPDNSPVQPNVTLLWSRLFLPVTPIPAEDVRSNGPDNFPLQPNVSLVWSRWPRLSLPARPISKVKKNGRMRGTTRRYLPRREIPTDFSAITAVPEADIEQLVLGMYQANGVQHPESYYSSMAPQQFTRTDALITPTHAPITRADAPISSANSAQASYLVQLSNLFAEFTRPEAASEFPTLRKYIVFIFSLIITVIFWTFSASTEKNRWTIIFLMEVFTLIYAALKMLLVLLQEYYSTTEFNLSSWLHRLGFSLLETAGNTFTFVGVFLFLPPPGQENSAKNLFVAAVNSYLTIYSVQLVGWIINYFGPNPRPVSGPAAAVKAIAAWVKAKCGYPLTDEQQAYFNFGNPDEPVNRRSAMDWVKVLDWWDTSWLISFVAMVGFTNDNVIIQFLRGEIYHDQSDSLGEGYKQSLFLLGTTGAASFIYAALIVLALRKFAGRKQRRGASVLPIVTTPIGNSGGSAGPSLRSALKNRGERQPLLASAAASEYSTQQDYGTGTVDSAPEAMPAHKFYHVNFSRADLDIVMARLESEKRKRKTLYESVLHAARQIDSQQVTFIQPILLTYWEIEYLRSQLLVTMPADVSVLEKLNVATQQASNSAPLLNAQTPAVELGSAIVPGRTLAAASAAVPPGSAFVSLATEEASDVGGRAARPPTPPRSSIRRPYAPAATSPAPAAAVYGGGSPPAESVFAADSASASIQADFAPLQFGSNLGSHSISMQGPIYRPVQYQRGQGGDQSQPCDITLTTRQSILELEVVINDKKAPRSLHPLRASIKTDIDQGKTAITLWLTGEQKSDLDKLWKQYPECGLELSETETKELRNFVKNSSLEILNYLRNEPWFKNPTGTSVILVLSGPVKAALAHITQPNKNLHKIFKPRLEDY